MKAIKEAYHEGLKALVKVPKQVYNADHLGSKIFACKNTYVHRKDFSM